MRHAATSGPRHCRDRRPSLSHRLLSSVVSMVVSRSVVGRRLCFSMCAMICASSLLFGFGDTAWDTDIGHGHGNVDCMITPPTYET